MKIFRQKILIVFHIFIQNLDCGYTLEPPKRGGSNEYPQFMFLSRNKKNNVYPCKPLFYYIKVGFKGVKIIYACFRDDLPVWLIMDESFQPCRAKRTFANGVERDETAQHVPSHQDLQCLLFYYWILTAASFAIISLLTIFYLTSHKRDIGKQCIPRSDTTKKRRLIRVYTVCIK